MKNYEIILAGSAWRAGVQAKADNMQRVVPNDLIKYAEFWLKGYDGKPADRVIDLRKRPSFEEQSS